MYHWYPRQWWTQNVTDVEVDCTDTQLERFLERVLTLQRYITLDDINSTTDFGIVSHCSSRLVHAVRYSHSHSWQL